MVEARPAALGNNESESENASDRGQLSDESFALEDVVIKPRNNFCDNALKLVTPKMDLSKKKASLSMSLNNIGGAGRSQSGMFKMSGRVA